MAPPRGIGVCRCASIRARMVAKSSAARGRWRSSSNDPQIQSDIAKQWAVVRTLCRGSHRQVAVPGAGTICETPPDELFNLPLVLAYSVMDQVLDELILQGTLPKPPGRNSILLGTKMDASRAHLSWLDYAEIELGKNARNDVAHEGILLPKVDCLRFINAIERELKMWGIIV